MSNNKQAENKQLKLIARKIKAARQEIGYSQKELGKALNLSDKTVSSYEVGRAQPNLQTLTQLSKITHKPVSYFLTAEDDKDIDLELKIKKIEQELLAIKKLLQEDKK